MASTTTLDSARIAEARSKNPTDLAHLEHLIEHAKHLLPAQGPITVFIHHNTLHAFEDKKFDEGVQEGSRVFGCHPYLTEERYRAKFSRGRIRLEDLDACLRDDLGSRANESICGLNTRHDLRLAMLQYPLLLGPAEELRWFVAETDALEKFRPETTEPIRQKLTSDTKRWIMRLASAGDPKGGNAYPKAIEEILSRLGSKGMDRWDTPTWEKMVLQSLWRIARQGTYGTQVSNQPALAWKRPRDYLLEETGVDADLLVDEILIRFCAAFLDQGLSRLRLPEREKGFFRAFCQIYSQPGFESPWMQGLGAELNKLMESGTTPLESIAHSLETLGISPDSYEEVISATLLALRGWAGMIHQVEIRGDRVATPAPKGSVTEYLAIRLLLDRYSFGYIAKKELGQSFPLASLMERWTAKRVQSDVISDEQKAFTVFQLAQLLGWSPETLQMLSKSQWGALVKELAEFSSVERRRIYHYAFERKFRTQTLDAITYRSRHPIPPRKETPRFQAIFCIDEREESLRRHLEEQTDQIETLGVAGFFAVPMYYRGAADAHFVPLCPVVIVPSHWVVEDVILPKEKEHQLKARARKALGEASHSFHVGSRSAAGGILTAGMGVLASFPLVMRVLFPRVTAILNRVFGRWWAPPSETRLRLERIDPTPSSASDGIGFSVPEMANSAERLLRDIGLTSNFARLVAIIGHGSTSMNNPHKSAYDCGACGGGAGGPNARGAAQILNDPRVRDILAKRGLEIPRETFFIGGFHNTCNDSVELFDLERTPKAHEVDYLEFKRVLEEALDRNAHERCRRFQSAPLDLSFQSARRHVEGRSEDLAQTRPECGHATNAICMVGRRDRTQGLYFDRRCFLVSYDPLQDTEGSPILTRILQAVVPVCGGINLEYYFSYVDSPGWGCGTKLPHNITSLLGVMDGAASDLRTGLPFQMVEIHEPVRLLFVIETTPETILQIMEKNPPIKQMIANGWVQVATLDPSSDKIDVYQDGVFHSFQPSKLDLPKVTSSPDWYRGWRDHLDFAVIEK